MGSSQRDIINFTAMEKELRAEIEAERKYQRENETKLRVIQQRSESYDEFRALVLACHLKPVEKKDRVPKIQPWNPVAPATRNTHLSVPDES